MINRQTRVRGMAFVLGFAAATAACGSSGDGNDGSGANGSGANGSGANGSGASGNSGGSGNGSGSGASSGVPTPFPGSGSADDPLTPGCDPSTKDQCGGTCEAGGGDDTTVIRPPATLCFAGAEDPTPDDPTAVIEQVIETVNGVSMVHLRIIFDPAFVDNTYGENAVGWGAEETTETEPDAMMPMPGMPKPPKMKGGHTFGDLVGSDHVELLLTDGDGNTVMDFKIDYVSEDASSPCGYASLGVEGGEGKVIAGDGSAVLDVATSIDRNLNGCGYCMTVDSPATDAGYTANSDAPNWDYRVVYEVWIALEAFGSSGFGQAYIESVHASPSKLATNTVEVFASPCPETWDTPFCPPELLQDDGTCATETGECPPNWEVYVATEGVVTCTPIPFSNYPDMKPCPEGYQLDAATEGRFCVPIP